MENKSPGVRDSGALFEENLGYADIPHKSHCTGLHFFGGSEGDSLANHAAPHMPLVKSGGGDLVYGDNYVQLAENAGFATTELYNIKSLTVILAMGDSYRLSDGVPSPALYMHIHNSSRISILRHYGTYDLFQTGLLDADVAFTNYLNGGPYGSRTRAKRKFTAEMTAISSDSNEVLMVAEDMGPIISRSSDVPAGNSAAYDGYDSPIRFGGEKSTTNPQDVVWRANAMMIYNRKLTESEIVDVWRNFLTPALKYRGCKTHL